MTIRDLGSAAVESIKQGSIKPLAREAVVQAGAWGTALATGEALGTIGFAIGRPDRR